MAEIASENNVTPKNIQNWKKIFLANASMAMEPEKAIKGYKAENMKLQKTIDDYAKTVGQLTLEKSWLAGKLKSLDLTTKKSMIESELEKISVVNQCKMIGLCRANHYYAPVINENIVAIKAHILNIYEEIPIYGSLKVHQQLLEDGYSICVNSVQKYRKELGLKAILAVRPPNMSQPIKEHKKYTYKLRGLDISRVNQVWSTDITYISLPCSHNRLAFKGCFELEYIQHHG